MKTRSQSRLELNNSSKKGQSNSKKQNSIQKKSIKTEISKLFENSLRCFIIKSLKHTKIGTFRLFKMEVNDCFCTYLIEKYQINQRYHKCSNLISDLKLATKSFIDINSYYKVILFQIKINKTKLIKYKNNCQRTITHRTNPSISARIQIQSNLVLTEADIEFLENF